MRLIALVLILMVLVVGLVIVDGGKNKTDQDQVKETPVKEDTQTPEVEETIESEDEPVDQTVKHAKVMASGDMLYHEQVYASGYRAETNDYDYSNNYEFITPLIQSADLALGDFEGTISPDFPLSGYPLFNAPPEVVPAIKAAGYDAITVAHNHILDSHLSGLFSTVKYFRDAGLDVFGVNTHGEDILVRDVNGIKVALLGYVYGFNGMEGLLTQEEYDSHMRDLNMDRIKADLARAEEIADVTIVMPQLGVEYALEPNQEQIDIYHQMIEWGADIIFGNHPHVVQPTEIIQKDGYDKFIIYSMGNLISNQRLETLDNIWTERGVITEVNLTKKGSGPVIIESIVPHVTWVNRTSLNRYNEFGWELFNYQTYVAEDFIAGGKHADLVDDATRERINSAHTEILELLNLQPLNGLKE